MEVKDIIRQRRIELDMTMREVAEKVGVSEGTISRWESGDIANMRRDKIVALAQTLRLHPNVIMGWEEPKRPTVINVPILGYVAAGIPISAITNIVDWEEFDPGRLTDHEYFGLRIKGDSMYPDLKDGDYVICQVTNDADNGDICIVQVNGDEATCKKIRKRKDELELVPINTQYDPIIYTAKEVETLPVTIIGKVVESRRKF
jgi:repressor LexA